ncbi:oxygen sensor histidine kinase NreB [mine drainage metagenome]|uniref:histidine kinase n=1 Tax=mine drainage metagenome TaxID=410659 RepID=A0A1J5QHK8_9ZZZZ
MSLRLRLHLLITALSLAFLVAAGWVIVNDTRDSIRERVEAATRVTVQLLDTVIVSSYQNPEWGYTHEVLKSFLQSLGYVRSNHITLQDLRGHLLYESPPTKYRSDVVPPDWFVKLVEPRQEVVKRRIRFGLLEVDSSSIGSIREAWSGMRRQMWIAFGFFLLLNGMVYWMLGRALKPVGSILGAIHRMEQGDLTVRLPEFKLPEFTRIGQNLNRMAESLETSTEENRRLALIVKQTGDAILIHDLDGNISFWNPAAERLFGYAQQDIIGHSAARLAPAEREGELTQNLAAISQRRLIENYDTQRVTRDGRLIDVSLSAAPMIDPHDGRVIGEICTMRDITERKHAIEAERRLEENRQLTHLIQRHIEDERRSLSRELHDELGQYVTAVKTFAVGIANKTQEPMPDVAAHARTIVAAADHIYDGMHNIIRQLRPGALDNLGLSEALRDSVAEWQSQHPEVRFSLNFSGKLDSLGETLNINLYRIVQESVTNALRYAQASTLEISFAEQENGALQLSIKDNGVGMNICNVDQSQHFGLLGMRERMQSLNGTFSLDSAPGEGTCITVTVPAGAKA